MENKIKQRRGSFSDQQSQQEGIVENEDDGVIRDNEHGTAIAIAAFTIHSLEQAELLKMMKEEKGPASSTSRTQSKLRKEGSISRKLSYVGNSKKKSFRQDNHEATFPLRVSSAAQSARPEYPLATASEKKQKGSLIPTHHNNNVNTKAESWKMAKTQKIQKRYEKVMFNILFWESEKKMHAKLKMEKKKGSLDHKRAMAMQHYQRKIARINKIAEKARTNLEDKRRKEESKVREKANKMRKTGSVPFKCFCFVFFIGGNKKANR